MAGRTYRQSSLVAGRRVQSQGVGLGETTGENPGQPQRQAGDLCLETPDCRQQLRTANQDCRLLAAESSARVVSRNGCVQSACIVNRAVSYSPNPLTLLAVDSLAVWFQPGYPIHASPLAPQTLID